MKRKSRSDYQDAEINITPMLDIVFILLIFFIVTTSFVKEIGIEVSRPTNTPSREKDISEVIAIRISSRGQIELQGREMDVMAVRANVESALALHPDSDVVIIASRDADAGLLVGVIDQARLAGATSVSLAANK
jgi:biopolymer transport protein ExbD